MTETCISYDMETINIAEKCFIQFAARMQNRYFFLSSFGALLLVK